MQLGWTHCLLVLQRSCNEPSTTLMDRSDHDVVDLRRPHSQISSVLSAHARHLAF